MPRHGGGSGGSSADRLKAAQAAMGQAGDRGLLGGLTSHVPSPIRSLASGGVSLLGEAPGVIKDTMEGVPQFGLNLGKDLQTLGHMPVAFGLRGLGMDTEDIERNRILRAGPLDEISEQMDVGRSEGFSKNFHTLLPTMGGVGTGVRQTGDRLVNTAAVPFGDLGWNESQYGQAYADGRMLATMLEDVGNVSMVAAGGGAVLGGGAKLAGGAAVPRYGPGGVANKGRFGQAEGAANKAATAADQINRAAMLGDDVADAGLTVWKAPAKVGGAALRRSSNPNLAALGTRLSEQGLLRMGYRGLTPETRVVGSTLGRTKAGMQSAGNRLGLTSDGREMSNMSNELKVEAGTEKAQQIGAGVEAAWREYLAGDKPGTHRAVDEYGATQLALMDPARNVLQGWKAVEGTTAEQPFLRQLRDVQQRDGAGLGVDPTPAMLRTLDRWTNEGMTKAEADRASKAMPGFANLVGGRTRALLDTERRFIDPSPAGREIGKAQQAHRVESVANKPEVLSIVARRIAEEWDPQIEKAEKVLTQRTGAVERLVKNGTLKGMAVVDGKLVQDGIPSLMLAAEPAAAITAVREAEAEVASLTEQKATAEAEALEDPASYPASYRPGLRLSSVVTDFAENAGGVLQKPDGSVVQTAWEARPVVEDGMRRFLEQSGYDTGVARTAATEFAQKVDEGWQELRDDAAGHPPEVLARINELASDTVTDPTMFDVTPVPFPGGPVKPRSLDLTQLSDPARGDVLAPEIREPDAIAEVLDVDVAGVPDALAHLARVADRVSRDGEGFRKPIEKIQKESDRTLSRLRGREATKTKQIAKALDVPHGVVEEGLAATSRATVRDNRRLEALDPNGTMTKDHLRLLDWIAKREGVSAGDLVDGMTDKQLSRLEKLADERQGLADAIKEEAESRAAQVAEVEAEWEAAKVHWDRVPEVHEWMRRNEIGRVFAEEGTPGMVLPEAHAVSGGGTFRTGKDTPVARRQGESYEKAVGATPLTPDGMAALVDARINTEFKNKMVNRIANRWAQQAPPQFAHLSGKDLVDSMSTWSKRTTGKELVPWDPQSETYQALTANQVDSNTLFIERALLDAARSEWKDPGAFELGLEKTLDPLNRAWKSMILPFSAQWQLGNTFGGVFLTVIAGDVPLSQVIDLWGEARKKVKLAQTEPWKLTPQERRLFSPQPDTAGYRALHETKQAKGTRLSRGIGGGLSRVTKGHVGDSMAEHGAISAAFELNESIDNTFKAITYLHHIDGIKNPTVKQIEHGVHMSLRALPDFTMSWAESRVARRIVPFYPWLRHVTVLSAKLARDNPARIAWMAALGDVASQDPDAIDIPWLGDSVQTGENSFINVGSLMPLSGNIPLDMAADLASGGGGIGPLMQPVSPILKMAVGATTGIDMDTMSQFDLSPGENRVDYLGRPSATPLLGKPRALAYQLANLTPQSRAVRDAYLPSVAMYDDAQPRILAERVPGTNDYTYDTIERAETPPWVTATGMRLPAQLVGLAPQTEVNVGELQAIRDERVARQRRDRDRYRLNTAKLGY